MKTTYKLAIAALFIDLGLILPFITGQVPQIGKMLLPMHLPVFLCAFICGWRYGGAVGLITPIFRSFVLGIPLLYPDALAMSVELAVYGTIAGMLYETYNRRKLWAVYGAMLPAMVFGRLAWGAAQVILFGLGNCVFSWELFIAGAFINAVPGIVLQLMLVPGIMSLLHLIQSKPKRAR